MPGVLSLVFYQDYTEHLITSNLSEAASDCEVGNNDLWKGHTELVRAITLKTVNVESHLQNHLGSPHHLWGVQEAKIHDHFHGNI